MKRFSIEMLFQKFSQKLSHHLLKRINAPILKPTYVHKQDSSQIHLTTSIHAINVHVHVVSLKHSQWMDSSNLHKRAEYDFHVPMASQPLVLNNLCVIIIIIIIIKICSVHISTLLGAQGAETEKTWIQTIYNDSKNNIMCRDTCTMQLQIYLWHKMSFKQRLKSCFTMTRFEFSWKMIPE